MSAFVEEIEIKASITAVWQTLSAIGEIYAWNPGVYASHTTSTQTEGIGATRFCDLGGKDFLDEKVVAWQPEEKLTMRIINTNLPFATADIHFTLRASPSGTLVTVSPRYKLKYGPLGALLDRFYVRKNYQKGMIALLAGLKRHVETEAPANSPAA